MSNAPQPVTKLPAARAANAANITDIDAAELKTDTTPVIRLGFWVLVVGFGLFLAWAAFAPLDEGVIAPATVSIETRRKAVQHLSGGVVKSVDVKEGQEVKQGDVLAVLDDAGTRAGVEAIRQNYLAQRALESRLLAEAAQANRITFHADLLQSNEPVAQQHMTVQQQLFNARRAGQVAEIAAARQSVVGLEGQIVGLRLTLDARKAQAALQLQQLNNVKSLAADGYAPRNQALQLEQTQAELNAAMADIQTNIQRAQSGIAETNLRIAQRLQEYTKEVSGLLADVRREVHANQERLGAVNAELGRMQVRAPVGGQVIGLAVNGPGAVITPGQRLLDIVPVGESLLLDAKIPPQVIDRIKAGDPVEVRFSAFANSPQLVVHGKLASLSRDAVAEQTPIGITTHFLGRVELTPEGRKALGNRELHAGMVAEVLVKTGERSLLTYLLHPLTKRLAAAMTEE